MITARASRILRWSHALGWGATLRNLVAVTFSSGDRLLTIPGLERKVRARANDSDLVMFEQVFIGGDYEFDLGFEPATIIDAGANAGYATLYFHRRYPAAKIIAVEPDPSTFETLVKNTAGIAQVSTVCGGLWSGRQALTIANPDAPKCMISLKPAGVPGEKGIEGYGVTDLMQMAGTSTIDVLKIDIEGGELEVFTANTAEWLPKVRVILIELHDRMRPGCAAAFYAALRGMRFTQWQKGDVLAIVNEDFRA
jgi:hypothetical protein